MPPHDQEQATLLPNDDAHELNDADKGRLVVRYVRAYARQRAAHAIDRLFSYCIPATIVCMLSVPFVAFAALLLLAGILGGDGTPQTGRHYPVG
jgi:hypothetical protein